MYINNFRILHRSYLHYRIAQRDKPLAALADRAYHA